MERGGATALKVRDLTKTFHGKAETVAALAGVSLSVREGELFTLLGPSGCGKTTTLRCVAGFEKPSSGGIDFHGRDFTALPPYRRNIGMVFQSYALFPHLSVFENVAYGLKVRKADSGTIQKKVEDILRLVGLEGAGRRKPGELSGGQQQRIALARALVYGPELLLLDEPLSNLDAKLRVYMREEIRRIQQQAGVTTVYVTHDQEEALSISDRIAVMHGGLVSQIGTPDGIYENPANMDVAEFIGQANFLPCRIRRDGASLSMVFPSGEEVVPDGLPPAIGSFQGTEGTLFLRPKHLSVRAGSGRQNSLRGKVSVILFLGTQVRYFVDLFSGPSRKEIMVDEERRLADVREGDEVSVTLRWDGARMFPPKERA